MEYHPSQGVFSQIQAAPSIIAMPKDPFDRYSQPPGYQPVFYDSRQLGTPNPRRSAFSQTRWHLLFTVAGSILFGLTAWFAQATFSADSTVHTQQVLDRYLKISFSSTLAVLRTLQGLTSTCTTYVLFESFEVLQWALASSDRGLRLLSLLSLSPATGLLGTFGIAFTRSPRMPDRLWALLKLILLIAVWSSGIVLFVNTDITTVYGGVKTYNVTAGVGQFNGSYVAPYLRSMTDNFPYRLLPYGVQAMLLNFVKNSEHAVVVDSIDCGGNNCDSYLFSGGLEMTTPWPPSGYDNDPVVHIGSAPACQIQFTRGLGDGDQFLQQDCGIFGAEGWNIGIEACLTQSQVSPGSYIAAVYVCSNGTNGGTSCMTTGTPASISTTFSVYSRQASVIVDRTNFSVISVADLGPPVQNTNIDIGAFKQALNWLLDFNTARVPPASSVAALFWQSQLNMGSAYWSVDIFRSLQSLLAYPLWQFQENNYGNPLMVQPSPDKMVDYLSAQYYTQASIAKPYVKISISRVMFMAFLILGALALGFAWIVLVWLWIARRTLPEISSYPLVDFACKTEGFHAVNLVDADNEAIRSTLKDTQIYLRSGVAGGRS